jgi:hypothetical protein
MKIEQVIYEPIGPGAFRAKLVDIQERAGSFGDFVLCVFEVLDGPHAGAKVSGACSARFSTQSKLYAWATALFGKAIPKKSDLDTDDLLGRVCQLEIETRANADGKVFDRIVSVRADRQAEQPRPSAAPSGARIAAEVPF